MTQHVQSRICYNARNSFVLMARSSTEPRSCRCQPGTLAACAPRDALGPRGAWGRRLCRASALQSAAWSAGVQCVPPCDPNGRNLFPQKGWGQGGRASKFLHEPRKQNFNGEENKNMKVNRTNKNKLFMRMKVKKGKLTETKGTTHFPQLRYQDQSPCKSKADR